MNRPLLALMLTAWQFTVAAAVAVPAAVTRVASGAEAAGAGRFWVAAVLVGWPRSWSGWPVTG